MTPDLQKLIDDFTQTYMEPKCFCGEGAKYIMFDQGLCFNCYQSEKVEWEKERLENIIQSIKDYKTELENCIEEHMRLLRMKRWM